MEKKFFVEKEKDKIITVLKAKKALLSQWYEVLDELQTAVEDGKDADSYLDDWETDDEGTHGFAYVVGCIDEDENGISVFPNFRGQVTLHKYEDGSWG